MALIDRFEERPLEPTRVHDKVVCGYRAVTIGDQRILQLETYGSRARKVPGKVSQVIQLDEASARDLKHILERAFPQL
jgi:hypothetical protein